ncbi:hypothetical protein OS493_016242 [Desmophyllum pertusum]|uniref:Uncharacterized protein n=1 Tax=Desmophyllum pertusum TaxID=174260 RepID=A0A9X0A209_9CNID|nr:hypothetical protein OS493_016242 [Desmophyllum pertusum]
MSAEYEPVTVSLGPLPECHDEEKTYDLKGNDKVSSGAKEVLVYAFVTTHGEGEFQRGYYEISTAAKDGKKFTQYMNVATGQGVKAVNSANLWLPIGDGKLNVKLVHSEGKKSIACKTDEHKDWSEVFIIGYRA